MTNDTELEFDFEEVIKEIENKNIYERNGIKIKINDVRNEDEYFVSLIDFTSNKEDNFCYFGFMNKNFLKNNFGQYSYHNGDLYIGNWVSDKKEGEGLYLHHNGDIYFGNWNNGQKNELGVNVWKIKNENTFDYHVFIGSFRNSYYVKGLYLSNLKKLKENLKTNSSDNILQNYIYFGEFNDHCMKSDNSSFVYNIQRNFIFNGMIFNDKSQSGYQIKYDNNQLSDTLYFEVNYTTHKVSKLKKESAIEDILKEKVLEETQKFIKKFINADYSIDRLLEIYDTLIEMTKQIDKNLDKIKIYKELITERLKGIIKSLDLNGLTESCK